LGAAFLECHGFSYSLESVLEGIRKGAGEMRKRIFVGVRPKEAPFPFSEEDIIELLKQTKGEK